MEGEMLGSAAIDAWQAFWQGRRVRRPLVGALVASYYPLKAFTEDRAGELVLPGDLTAEAVLEDFRLAAWGRRAAGAALWVASAPLGIPWLEAVIGCPIRATCGTAWPERPSYDWQEYDLASVPWDNGWLAKLKELTGALVQAVGGHWPVGPGHLRGPTEAAAAMLGYEQMAYSLYDSPEELRRLL